MKQILSFYILLLSLNLSAQKDNKITIGTIDSLQSKILNEQRQILIYVPNSWKSDSKKRYPVLYLLDGDTYFNSVVGMVQRLGQVDKSTFFPEMIVVGISNTDRTRDFTPTHVQPEPLYVDAESAKVSGGGDKFASFIENELIPNIDSKYPTNQHYKVLVGHSFGGLEVINIVANHTSLFNSYICIDPSIWWDDMNFLKTTKNTLTKKNFSDTSLFLGIANTLEDGIDIKDVRKDTSKDSRHIRSILELNEFLKSQKQSKLKYESKYYPDDNHGSVPTIATYDGLRFIFDKYRFKYSSKDLMDSKIDLANKFEKHYKEISEYFGFNVYPPENTINGLGYQFLQQQQYSKAESFFKMNVDNYPESYNGYDSYGDYFLAVNNKAKAIECFKKALLLKEIPDIRIKLNSLQN